MYMRIYITKTQLSCLPIHKKAHTNDKMTDLLTGVAHIHTNKNGKKRKKKSKLAVTSRGRSSAGGFLRRHLLLGLLHGLDLRHLLLLRHVVLDHLGDSHALGDLLELLVVVLRDAEVLLQQVVHRVHSLAQGGDLLLQFADAAAGAAADAACTAVHG